jgi:hypothetical protein
MTTATLPLEDLVQRITQQQSDLENLRREFEARQAKLADLTRRKQELARQLQELEAEIQGVATGNPKPQVTPQAEPTKPAPEPKSARGMKLADLLVAIVAEGGGQPVAVRHLAKEVTRRKFPTTSANIPGLVQTRIGELVRQGLLQRVPGRLGVIPAKTTNGKTAGPRPTAKPKARKQAPAQTPKGPKPDRPQGQPPLREVLVNVLKKSRQPLTSGQLAAEVLATGYQTVSKDFATVVSVALSKMPGLAHVPGKGFRLKKGRG